MGMQAGSRSRNRSSYSKKRGSNIALLFSFNQFRNSARSGAEFFSPAARVCHDAPEQEHFIVHGPTCHWLAHCAADVLPAFFLIFPYMGEPNCVHPEIRGKEFLNGLKDPSFTCYCRPGAVCHFPIEVFFRRFLEWPLTHLGWYALYFYLVLLFLNEFLSESESLNWIVRPCGLSMLLSTVITPLEPDERRIRFPMQTAREASFFVLHSCCISYESEIQSNRALVFTGIPKQALRWLERLGQVLTAKTEFSSVSTYCHACSGVFPNQLVPIFGTGHLF
jgi:hypothetical protein